MQHPLRIAIWINGKIARNAVGLTARVHRSSRTIVQRVTCPSEVQDRR